MTDKLNQTTNSDCHEKKKKKAPGRNFWKLSWLAEEADGWRDEELRLTLHPVEGLRLRRKGEALDANEKEVCKIETPKCQPGRTPVLSVTVGVKDAKAKQIDPAEGWDALFWTESAVEKFLYPYYHAHRLWDDTMEEVRKAFETYPGAVAVKHKAPSNSFVMYAADSLQIGALDLSGKFQWMSVPQFLEVADAYKLKEEGGGPAAGDHEPNSPEPAGAR